MIHKSETIIGEWFLVNKTWNDTDLSLMVFLSNQNAYTNINEARLRIENASLNVKFYLDGPYEVTYEGNRVQIEITKKQHQIKYYGLAEISEETGTDSEGLARATMKFELSKSPISGFSENVRIYRERGRYNPRYDA